MKTLDKYLQAKQNLANAKEEVDNLAQLLMDEMHKEGNLSVKRADGTVVSIATRVTKQVDELTFNKWIAEQPDMERDMFYVETLDKAKAVALADKILKEDGEIAPYISGVTETEYVSVRVKK